MAEFAAEVAEGSGTAETQPSRGGAARRRGSPRGPARSSRGSRASARGGWRAAPASAAGGGESSGASKGATSRSSTAEDSGAAADLSIFQSALASSDAADGRRVVEALEQLKLPDEAAMGARAAKQTQEIAEAKEAERMVAKGDTVDLFVREAGETAAPKQSRKKHRVRLRDRDPW